MDRKGNLGRPYAFFLLAMCTWFIFAGCITYRTKDTPGIPYLQEDLRYTDQAPLVLVVHTHSHLVRLIGTCFQTGGE